MYGPRNDDLSGGLVWNPVKKKLLAGQRFFLRTVQGTFPATSDATYCNAASLPVASGSPDLVDPDATWTEMQHSGLTWGDAWRMWAYGSSAKCPNRKAIPGVRIAYTNEQEIQHALDGGAMVLVVPTVDTAECHARTSAASKIDDVDQTASARITARNVRRAIPDAACRFADHCPRRYREGVQPWCRWKIAEKCAALEKPQRCAIMEI